MPNALLQTFRKRNKDDDFSHISNKRGILQTMSHVAYVAHLGSLHQYSDLPANAIAQTREQWRESWREAERVFRIAYRYSRRQPKLTPCAMKPIDANERRIQMLNVLPTYDHPNTYTYVGDKQNILRTLEEVSADVVQLENKREYCDEYKPAAWSQSNEDTRWELLSIFNAVLAEHYANGGKPDWYEHSSHIMIVYRLDWRHYPGGKVYIGSTKRWPARLEEHRKHGGLGFNLGEPKPRMVIGRYTDRSVAYRKEEEAINAVWPACYNKQRKAGDRFYWQANVELLPEDVVDQSLADQVLRIGDDNARRSR